MPAVPGDQQVPRPQEVFISYSRKDKEFVRRLHEALSRRDREAWVDWEDIRPTEEFMQAIYGAIEGADTFIFVLTPDSVASVVCAREIAHAAAHNKRMVPIVAREVNPDTVPEALGKLNWIFCRDSDDLEKATDTLISALDTDLEWVHAHTRLLTRAIEWENKGKNNSFVLRGDDLRAAEQWLAQAGIDKERQPTALQTEYILASRKAAARRQRLTLGAVSFGFVVAVVLAVLALFARKEAIRQRDVAVQQQKISRSRELAASALNQLPVDPELSILLALEAARFWPTLQAEASLRQALLRSHVYRTLPGHQAEVRQASFSADSHSALTASADRTAILWNVDTGERTAEMRDVDAYSPVRVSPDGKLLLLISVTGTARLCDSFSGKTVSELVGPGIGAAVFGVDGIILASIKGSVAQISQKQPDRALAELRGHTKNISKITLSPDGRFAVTQSKDNTARLWETTMGQCIATWNSPSNQGWGAVFSPDSKLLVHGGPDYTALVHDVVTGQVISELRTQNGAIKHYEFSADSKLIATAHFNGAARVWNPATGETVVEVRGAAGPACFHVAFSPDGRFIVTSDSDNAARIWLINTGEIIAVLRAPGTVARSAFSPDGCFVISGGSSVARIWAVPKLIELRGHTDVIWHAAFSPDGKLLVTAGRNKISRVWDVVTGKQLSELGGHTNAVWTAVFSRDGKRIITASADHTARLWDAETGRSLFELRGHTNDVRSAAFSPDGRLALTAGDNTARLWDAETGKLLHELRGHSDAVTRAVFSPDGKLAATASNDATARTWDVATGNSVAELRGHEKRLEGVAFSPNGKLLATASEDTTSRVWEVPGGKLVSVLRGQKDSVATAVFSPDSKLVVTRQGSEPLVFDAVKGEQLLALRGHSGEITSASFSPDGQFVLTSAHPGEAIVWETATGNQVMDLHGFKRGIDTAVFSPDGRTIVTAGFDPADHPPIYGIAQIRSAEVCRPLDELLTLASHRVTRSLSDAERATYLHESAVPAGQSRSIKPGAEGQQQSAAGPQPQTTHQPGVSVRR